MASKYSHPLPFEERFWPKVRLDPGGCWTWIADRDKDGYGRFFNEGQSRRMAHRVAYERFVGPIPPGLTLDHLCRNRACVNPAHMEPVTIGVNSRRGSKAMQTHCVNGHAFDEANTYRRPGGQRDCRKCMAERQRRSKQRRQVA